MTETLTPIEQATLCGDGRCDVPLYDGFTLCPTHTGHLSKDLAAVGDVWANLRVTIRRQDATSSAIGGGATGSRPCMNLDAHDKGETLASVLNGWAGALAGGYRVRSAAEAAAFLAQHMRMVVKEDWAGDLAQELAASLAECRRATDRALDVISLGVCGFGDCDGLVTAVVGSPTGKCRSCHAVWDVAERQQWMIGQAWHATASLRLLVRALRDSKHITISYDTAKKWAQRSKLYGRCDLATREHQYTAADIYHSCHNQPATRAKTPLDVG
ncbi:hypothetical protein ASF21_12815 [Arthrobacter sp. Leaf234]|uniref:hypothetical protein n=1 Tax=Arthrobacter sp. Leaf234 TaxID=1736303 RepID=UPI0006F8C63F|nr:hypothetical protein [Arthrobacter sp. Leaf234]KQN99683.1 hypothetical protein ASF21_12815 [Arthrobacter sp. Leaf234]